MEQYAESIVNIVSLNLNDVIKPSSSDIQAIAQALLELKGEGFDVMNDMIMHNLLFGPIEKETLGYKHLKEAIAIILEKHIKNPPLYKERPQDGGGIQQPDSNTRKSPALRTLQHRRIYIAGFRPRTFAIEDVHDLQYNKIPHIPHTGRYNGRYSSDVASKAYSMVLRFMHKHPELYPNYQPDQSLILFLREITDGTKYIYLGTRKRASQSLENKRVVVSPEGRTRSYMWRNKMIKIPK